MLADSLERQAVNERQDTNTRSKIAGKKAHSTRAKAGRGARNANRKRRQRTLELPMRVALCIARVKSREAVKKILSTERQRCLNGFDEPFQEYGQQERQSEEVPEGQHFILCENET
jgi:hypothetical protein